MFKYDSTVELTLDYGFSGLDNEYVSSLLIAFYDELESAISNLPFSYQHADIERSDYVEIEEDSNIASLSFWVQSNLSFEQLTQQKEFSFKASDLLKDNVTLSLFVTEQVLDELPEKKLLVKYDRSLNDNTTAIDFSTQEKAIFPLTAKYINENTGFNAYEYLDLVLIEKRFGMTLSDEQYQKVLEMDDTQYLNFCETGNIV